MEREGKDYVKEKQEIREFFYRYGKAIDAHDWGALEDIFHDDMNAHYKASLFRIDLSHKGDKVSTIKWLKANVGMHTKSSHLISNIMVEMTSDKTATATALLHNPMRLGFFNYMVSGKYRHKLVKGNNGTWRSLSLESSTDWLYPVLTLEQFTVVGVLAVFAIVAGLLK